MLLTRMNFECFKLANVIDDNGVFLLVIYFQGALVFHKVHI